MEGALGGGAVTEEVVRVGSPMTESVSLKEETPEAGAHHHQQQHIKTGQEGSKQALAGFHLPMP